MIYDFYKTLQKICMCEGTVGLQKLTNLSAQEIY